MTPLQAIRKVCVACVGSVYEVKDCGGNKCLGGQGNENESCYFFHFRLGKGRSSVKLIRKFCLECMGGSSRLVAVCESVDCPLHQYRFGKNPKRAGLTHKGSFKPAVRRNFLSQNRSADTNE
jgi:hypothetical protein